jgi:hypothetical protein
MNRQQADSLQVERHIAQLVLSILCNSISKRLSVVVLLRSAFLFACHATITVVA